MNCVTVLQQSQPYSEKEWAKNNIVQFSRVNCQTVTVLEKNYKQHELINRVSFTFNNLCPSVTTAVIG